MTGSTGNGSLADKRKKAGGLCGTPEKEQNEACKTPAEKKEDPRIRSTAVDNPFGKVSRLKLEASLRGGKTILSDLYFTAPFKVMRPFYEKKELMSVLLLTASAGIMAGDRQEMELCVRKGASMEISSQAYEKIHKMDRGCALRTVRIHVEQGGCLRYLPLPVIPFGGSDYASDLEVELEDETSRFILADILTCGRAAHGERFRYRRFSSRVSIRQGGKLIYRDNTRYEPEQMAMQGFGLYEGYSHLAALVFCNIPISDSCLADMRRFLDENASLEGGASRTAQGNLVVKILGNSAEQLTEAARQILSLLP